MSGTSFPAPAVAQNILPAPNEPENSPHAVLPHPASSLQTGKICTHHASVVLEVQENTISSLPWLALSHDNRGHDLLSQLGLSLLNCSHNHITDTSCGQSVQAGTDTLDGDNV
jgi:hypothetical protein